jgi:hypothetical protein
VASRERLRRSGGTGLSRTGSPPSEITLVKTLAVAMLAIACTASTAWSQDTTGAYVNEAAREMVRLARQHRSTVDRRIQRYQTTARERFTVALSAGIADKLLYRRETATRIDWRREGPVRFDVLGIRDFAPVANAKPVVPKDISADMLNLAFDPSNADVLIRIDTTEISHPLNPGSEKAYRFEAGDTTVIALPDGRTVRLHELRVMPRYRSPILFSGSLWLEAQSHAIVQAYIRPGRAIDGDTDVSVSASSSSDSTGARKENTLLRIMIQQAMGVMKPLRLDVDFIAIDYGLWDLEYWLPRTVIARGVAQVSRFRVPITYERSYADYDVTGNAAVAFAPRPDSTVECRARVRFVLPEDSMAVDTVRQTRTDSEMARRDSLRAARGEVQACVIEYVVSAPPDSILLTSPDLPTNVYGDDFELVAGHELDAIISRVRMLESPSWRMGRSVVQWGLNGPGLFRYNRVEGASFGARLIFDAGFAMVRPEIRYGFADEQVRGELMLERAGDPIDWQLAAYRRLRSASMASRAHSLASSFGALLFGIDDEDYFDARGFELTLRPSATRTQWFAAQIYAERQNPVERNTTFSVSEWFGDGFDENMVADSADQFGARVTLRTGVGRLGHTPRLDAELTLGGETGDYTFTRNDLMVRLEAPIAGPLSAAVEGAVGTIEGDSVPAQALWRLDSGTMLRGYPRGSAVGERYWRTRTELSYGLSYARFSVFSDVAWAGPRTRFDSDGVLSAYGVGVRAFNDMLRLDVARGMTEPGGWRLHVRLNPRL